VARQLPRGERNPVEWATQGKNVVTAARFFAYLKQEAEQYDALARYPHHPPLPRTLYVHPPLEGGDGKALTRLLAHFLAATFADRDLLLSLLLTLVWGGRPGARPAFLLTRDPGASDDGRGIGKSSLAHLAARLVGGHIELDTTARRDEVATRLLSGAGQALRVVLLDNIKALRLSWAELEGFITSPVISGHQMYVGEGQRPNAILWLLTLNGAGLSKDMAQRVVPIYLRRPSYSATWRDEVEQFVEANRWAILGDLVAMLKGDPARRLGEHTRWGAWEDEVLSRVGNPDEAQAVVAERQGSIDVDEDEADLVRGRFAAELKRRQHEPDAEVIRIPSEVAAVWFCEAAGEKLATCKATVRLQGLGVPELRKSDRGKARGWVWHGEKSSATATATGLRDLPKEEPAVF
jgi:hypothetical protein